VDSRSAGLRVKWAWLAQEFVTAAGEGEVEQARGGRVAVLLAPFGAHVALGLSWLRRSPTGEFPGWSTPDARAGS